MRRRLLVALTDQLEPEQRDAVTRLCEEAFQEPWRDAWADVGPGLHVLSLLDGGLVGHAMVVDRLLHVGLDDAVGVDAGYVEWVAVTPGAQRRGHGAEVMGQVARIIDEGYALGALATGTPTFYERLGWERWIGPTSVLMPDGERARTPEQDGHVLVLRTGRSATVDVTMPIACEWRRGDVW
jgi:aminoglycoside 2'-N-acetyltransferase I